MQVLSDRLVEALEKYGGKLLMRHTVEKVEASGDKVTGVRIRNQKTGEVWIEPAEEVVANVTVQNLVKLLGDSLPRNYQRRVDKLPPASGAFVIYLGVEQSAIPAGCPPHLQFLYDYSGLIGENNSLFVSVSKPGDGRAPLGKATIIASSFTDASRWWQGSQEDYEKLKAPIYQRCDRSSESIFLPQTRNHYPSRSCYTSYLCLLHWSRSRYCWWYWSTNTHLWVPLVLLPAHPSITSG